MEKNKKMENITLPIKMNQVYCIDSFELLKKIPDEYVELLLTDIPYGVINRESGGLRSLDKGSADVFNLDLSKLIKEFIRVTKGSIYVFCGTEQVSEIRKIMVEQGLSTRLGIWQKTNPSPMNGEYLWLSAIECCVYGRKKGAVFNEHCKGSVWKFPTEKTSSHPTQKPLKLFKYLIEVSSNEKDLVLDPFLGSGTTAVACKQLNRNFIGGDIDPKFIRISKKRLAQNTLHDLF